MPPKKQKPKKQKPYKKKTKQKIPTAPTPYYLCKLKYSDEYVFTVGGAGGTNPETVNRIFCVNDLYDPSISTTGHQPYFRDQLFALYDMARVLSAKVTIQLVTPNANTCEALFFHIPENTIETDFTVAKERKGTKYSIMNSVKHLKFVKYCSIHKDLGVSKKTILLDDLHIQRSNGTMSQTVQDQYQLTVRTLNPNSATSSSIYVNILIEQIALFSGQRQQIRS